MKPGLLRCLLLALAVASHALPALPATEDELRAAMIYNIARFVQWPRVGQEMIMLMSSGTCLNARPYKNARLDLMQFRHFARKACHFSRKHDFNGRAHL